MLSRWTQLARVGDPGADQEADPARLSRVVASQDRGVSRAQALLFLCARAGLPCSALTAWAAVLMGMITHVGIGKAKRSQTRGGLPPILAIGELPLMISAKGGQIMLRLLLALIGLLGLVFAMGVSRDIAISAFLLGYSLDSFTEMFGTNVAQRAEIQFGDLAKRFGGMGGVA